LLCPVRGADIDARWTGLIKQKKGMPYYVLKPRDVHAFVFVCAMGFGGLHVRAAPEVSDSAEDLTRLSLSDLANVEVTSVSKTTQSLQRAAASIYLITHDDIQRSSATNVFEVLRLAPNLIHKEHLEFAAPNGEYITRSVLAEAKCRF
jgi:hypothetical protein